MPEASEPRASFRELASDALRFWEPRRALYNLVLLGVVCVHLSADWPESKSLLTVDGLFVFFILAVLANVAYCAAYAVDLFVQFSGLRAARGRWRWSVWVVGTAFAAVITHFFAHALLSTGKGA
jgi:hypothetical protein